VERIKAQEVAEEEHKQARMRELAEQARERREAEAAEEERRNEGRDAKLRRSQDEKAKGEEQRARDSARRSWKASVGTEAAFDRAWPSMWEEMLKRRTADADRVGWRVKRWPEAASAVFREGGVMESWPPRGGSATCERTAGGATLHPCSHHASSSS
jgi:hypothetical protein